MPENRRDTGLVRVLTSWGLAASIFNTVVGAGIYAVPAALADSVGVYAPLIFLVCAVAIGSVAICFAEGGSRIATSGGAYGYIEASFGPLAGCVGGTLLWFGNVLSSGAIAAALADGAAGLFPEAARAAAHVLVIVAAIGGIAWVNIGGPARGARLAEGMAVLKLLPLAVFLAAGAGAIRASTFWETGAPTPAGFGRGVILALFAFTGMEIPLSASGEVARPGKTIPRALMLATLPIVLLYILIQIIAQGILGAALARSAAPLADAMGAVHPALRVLMLAGAAVSMAGFLSSDILGTPRMLFAFGRDGLLPRVVGRVHPRTHAPHVAILSYAAVACALAMSGTFAELAVLATLASAALYILSCAAAWRLARGGVAQAGAPLNFPWIGSAAVIGTGSMLLLIALASRAEIAGLVGVIAVSALVDLGRRHFRKPALAEARSSQKQR